MKYSKCNTLVIYLVLYPILHAHLLKLFVLFEYLHLDFQLLIVLLHNESWQQLIV